MERNYTFTGDFSPEAVAAVLSIETKNIPYTVELVSFTRVHSIINLTKYVHVHVAFLPIIIMIVFFMYCDHHTKLCYCQISMTNAFIVHAMHM